MKVTHGLFENSQRLDLVLNNIITISSDSSNIVRSFNLTITFNPTDIVFIDGRIVLSLQNKKTKNGKLPAGLMSQIFNLTYDKILSI